jgi:hypothetical protein
VKLNSVKTGIRSTEKVSALLVSKIFYGTEPIISRACQWTADFEPGTLKPALEECADNLKKESEMLETKRLKELALIGLRLEREQIDREIHAINTQLGTCSPLDITGVLNIKPAPKTKPRTISPEGRQKLSLLAKRRWKAARKNGKAAL